MPQEKVSPWKRLLQLLVLERKDITSIYFYAILSGLVSLSLPLGIQTIIGFVQGSTMVTSIYVLVTVVVIGVAVVGILKINQMKIIEKIQQQLFVKYAIDFSETIPRLDLTQNTEVNLTEKINRFFDTITVQKGFSKLLLDIPVASIEIIFGLILISLYHPLFIVFGLLMIGLLWLIFKISSKPGLETSLTESKYKYKVVEWFEEMATVLESFKYSQGTHLNLIKTDENVLGYLHARTKHFRVLLSQYSALVIFKVLVTSALLIVGTYLLIEQQLNIGEFIAAEIVIISLLNAVEKLISSLDNIYDVITGLEKLANVTEGIKEKNGHVILNENTRNIEIEAVDIKLSYDNQKNILKNVNFKVGPNKIVVINGDEGSGKSSLTRLLSGNYFATSGSLLFNHIPIHNYDLQSLRQAIGISLGEERLFSGTLMQNITLGSSKITEAHIRNVAAQLGFTELINSLPMGLNTPLNAYGKKLSSQTLKKVSLLKALVKNSPIIILEEPWLGLESSLKPKILAFLQNQKIHSIIFIVTRDTDALAMADAIIEMNEGKAQLKTLK